MLCITKDVFNQIHFLEISQNNFKCNNWLISLVEGDLDCYEVFVLKEF